ncbi:MAG: helix-turn-helix domain-containing protein [Alphaproteobacteria bacterium]|nr:helix-turn-helix domain-containing protein [Alphaproteobacteria bacterium]
MTRKNDKTESLRRLGTLNRHPERVSDPRFLSEPFFDPRDLVQVRYEMLRRVRREGQSVSESAQNFGVSRPTWYHAASAFEENGLAGLVPERPGPRRAHKLDDIVIEALVEARRAAPATTTAELVVLVRRRFGISVHRRSIERALGRVQKKR